MVLHVTVVELPSRWGEPEHALLEVDEILGRAPTTATATERLVLLPEASLTGYVSPEIDFDLTPFAEPIDGPSARALAGLARKHGTHLFGPLILEEDGALYNATVGFSPSGEHIVTYRKRHPWVPERWASAGTNEYPLLDVAGVRVTIACCFDVHFLHREAARTLDEADLLLFPSAWVEDDIDTRPRRLKTIARRHRIAVAAANWGRGAVRVPGQGNSFILNRSGDVVVNVPRGARRADASLDL